MASPDDVLKVIAALETHCPAKLMTSEQRKLWLNDWCNDLAGYSVGVIQEAARKYRLSGNAKFPTIGQLGPFLRDVTRAQTTVKIPEWHEPSEDEYRVMPLSEKITYHQIKAHDAGRRAGPMFRNVGNKMPLKGPIRGQHLTADEMPPEWHEWKAKEKFHRERIRALRGFVAEAREKPAQPRLPHADDEGFAVI